jgi:hypothetical protein
MKDLCYRPILKEQSYILYSINENMCVSVEEFQCPNKPDQRKNSQYATDLKGRVQINEITN